MVKNECVKRESMLEFQKIKDEFASINLFGIESAKKIYEKQLILNERIELLKETSNYMLFNEDIISAYNHISLDASLAVDLNILENHEYYIINAYSKKIITEFKAMQEDILNKYDKKLYNLSLFKPIACYASNRQREVLNKLYNIDTIDLIVDGYVRRYGQFNRVMSIGYSDGIEVRESVIVNTDEAIATIEIYLSNEREPKIIKIGTPINSSEYAEISEENSKYSSLCNLRDYTISFLKKVEKIKSKI